MDDACNADERSFKFELTTDSSGSETRWVLKKKRQVILRGPAQGTKFNSQTTYVKDACLSTGKYKLVIVDISGNGLARPGGYAWYLDGKKIFSSADDEKWKKRIHRFIVKPTLVNVDDPTCTLSEQKVKVDIKTDKWGGDTSWVISER
jgi:hypothetical protein